MGNQVRFVDFVSLSFRLFSFRIKLDNTPKSPKKKLIVLSLILMTSLSTGFGRRRERPKLSRASSVSNSYSASTGNT